MDRKAETEYALKYQKKHIRQIKFALSIENDADILEYLDKIPNRAGYLKDLIRRDMVSGTMRGIGTVKPGEEYPTGNE